MVKVVIDVFLLIQIIQHKWNKKDADDEILIKQIVKEKKRMAVYINNKENKEKRNTTENMISRYIQKT